MIVNLLKELGKLPRHLNSPSYDYSIKVLSEKYGLDVITYDSSSDHNGWVIPPKYSVKNAYIKFKNKIIYNGKSHPLSVISYSAPFAGIVSKDELIKHCFYDHRNEDWIPYHFRQSYRPWQRNWGFCVPKKFINTLIDGEYYEVLIQIEEGKKELKIGKGIINGQ
jgi:aminopeptidase-like protein